MQVHGKDRGKTTWPGNGYISEQKIKKAAHVDLFSKRLEKHAHVDIS
jgi:hypothetical protein